MRAFTMPIDTQRVVDQLTEHGVSVDQAKAHASVLSEALQSHDAQIDSRCRSKEDLADALGPVNAAIPELQNNVRDLQCSVKELQCSVKELQSSVSALDSKIDGKIDSLKRKLEAKIEASASKVRSDVITWIISAQVLQTAFNTALVQRPID